MGPVPLEPSYDLIITGLWSVTPYGVTFGYDYVQKMTHLAPIKMVDDWLLCFGQIADLHLYSFGHFSTFFSVDLHIVTNFYLKFAQIM